MVPAGGVVLGQWLAGLDLVQGLGHELFGHEFSIQYCCGGAHHWVQCGCGGQWPSIRPGAVKFKHNEFKHKHKPKAPDQ